MIDPTPAAGGLSDEERQMLACARHSRLALTDDQLRTVQRIIAARTEAADRDAARVTAAMEALAATWDEDPGMGDYITLTEAVDALRAALSSAGTDALDRERTKAWDEGWNACFGYLSAEYVGPDDPPNPYRAAAVSPEGGSE